LNCIEYITNVLKFWKNWL